MKPADFSRLAILLLLPALANGEQSVTGYLKSFAVGQAAIDNPVFTLPEVYQSQNAGRVMWSAGTGNLMAQAHYELSPVLVSRALPVESATFNVITDNYRLTDLVTSLSDEQDKNQVYQNLDRLNVQWRLEAGDITIGRQAIAMGSARIINPTDVFLPFDVRTFNTEYRTGVDAIRYQRPWGELGEIDMGVVLGKDARAENSAAFLQLRGNTRGMDLQFAAMYYAEQSLIGGGIQSAIGSVGFWLEVAAVSGDDDYIRFSTGIDYAFTDKLFTMVEYHHNGIGADDPADYIGQFDQVAYQKGGVFLLGRDYLIPSLSYQLSPIWTLTAQALLNISDQSAFWSLSGSRSLSDNLYADVGIYLFSGDDLTLGTGGLPALQSEYGANPSTVFASLRWYF